MHCRTDVANPDQLSGTFDHIIEDFGRIDNWYGCDTQVIQCLFFCSLTNVFLLLAASLPQASSVISRFSTTNGKKAPEYSM